MINEGAKRVSVSLWSIIHSYKYTENDARDAIGFRLLMEYHSFLLYII